jgi:uncharacterized protein (TIGR02466 family)
MDIKYSFKAGTAPVARQTPMLRRNEIFPTVIWQAHLTALGSSFPDWISEVEALRARDPEPAGRTNRGGWNSHDQAVLEAPAFAALKAPIVDLVHTALSEMLGSLPDITLQSWINIHDRGGFNFLHVHEGSLLCGCFYLRVPEGSGPLVFRDPRPGVVHGSLKGNGANAYKDIRLAPSDGLLVLFPSWLEHYVEPHDGDLSRIAIPFNVLQA